MLMYAGVSVLGLGEGLCSMRYMARHSSIESGAVFSERIGTDLANECSARIGNRRYVPVAKACMMSRVCEDPSTATVCA